MGRTARDKRPYVKPVQKIELSDNNVKRRIIFVALFLVLGAFFISRAVSYLLNEPADWVQVKAESSIGLNCGSDFAFYYKLGQGEKSASAEKRQVSSLYTTLCHDAYQIFENVEEIDDCKNIYYINRHPNEVIEVEEALYKALEQVEKTGCRNIYLAPIYEYYYNIFFCEDDSQTFDYDPYQNEEIADFYREVTEFARDEKAVNIEFKGNNKIRLNVSDEYLKYAEVNAVNSYVDFGWMKNAFIADYIADSFIQNGLEYGIISSYDGFSRSFIPDEEQGTANINCLGKDELYMAASMNYTGNLSSVTMRKYKVIDLDSQYYYAFSDGEVRTSYVDIEEGKCKSAVDQLTMYSKDVGCAQIVMQMAPLYIADELDVEAAFALKGQNIFTVLCKDNVINYNGDCVEFTDFYKKDNTEFVASFVE